MTQEIRKAAQVLIAAYGNNAAAVAAKRAENLKEGAIEGAASTWLKIARAVLALQAEDSHPRKTAAPSRGHAGLARSAQPGPHRAS